MQSNFSPTGMQVLKFSFSHLYQYSRNSHCDDVIENLFWVSHKVEALWCVTKISLFVFLTLAIKLFSNWYARFKFSFSHLYQYSRNSHCDDVIENLFWVSHKVEALWCVTKISLFVFLTLAIKLFSNWYARFKFSFSHLYQYSRNSHCNDVTENLFWVSHKVEALWCVTKISLFVFLTLAIKLFSNWYARFKFSFSHLYQYSRNSHCNDVTENLFWVSHKVEALWCVTKISLLVFLTLVIKLFSNWYARFKFSFSHLYQYLLQANYNILTTELCSWRENSYRLHAEFISSHVRISKSLLCDFSFHFGFIKWDRHQQESSHDSQYICAALVIFKYNDFCLNLFWDSKLCMKQVGKIT